jgi:RNA polymerase sigma-70 factor (sigma-E family)
MNSSRWRQPSVRRRRYSIVNDRFSAEFGELFRVAYRAAYSVLGDRAEAEDCAQEALAGAFVRWNRIESYAVPWVARVAANQALDRTRRAARRRHRPLDERDHTPATGPDVLAERRRDLVTALRSLPRRQRDAVVLRHLVDLSEADAAAGMGCSVGTVKSAVSRGIARLRDELGASWALEA